VGDKGDDTKVQSRGFAKDSYEQPDAKGRTV